MPVNIGSTNIGRIYLGSTEIAEVYLGSTKIFGSSVDPYNPLGLPQYTIRARFSGTPAATANGGFSGTITNVSGDIYDIQTSNWVKLFGASGLLTGGGQIDKKPVEVLGANCTSVTSLDSTFYGCSSLTSIPLMDTSSVTSMDRTFYGCTALTSVPLFDTSSVTDMQSMFYNNSSLTSVPAFDTHNVTNFSYMFSGAGIITAPALSTGSATNFSYMFRNCTSMTSVPQYNMTSAQYTSYMFTGCTNVSSGALSLYNSVSQQVSPPSVHMDMFRNCGANTTNGLAELKQIPGDWGGRYGEITCEKYYYSSANTDLAAYSPRAATGYLAGAIWTPIDNGSYTNSLLYSIKTPATAGTMRIYPTSRFYKWNTSTTQSSSTSVSFGAFAIPKSTLSRQAVYSSYYGWRSNDEPIFLYRIASAGTAPSSGYISYTPPVNTTYNITSNFPAVPATWTILLCLYIYTNSTYYFGTVARNNYGYLPYTSNDDLIIQVSNTTQWS